MARPLNAAAAFVGMTLVALALAILALRPPEARPPDAPAGQFSAARAFADIRQVAQRPHPVGSAESIRVRAYLLQRLEGLGLRATVRSAAARRRDGSGVMVHNLLGVLPGTDPALPALVLMSHHDSTPHGPGAGDDAAGVAASLEIVRALKSTGPHRRDVMVLITDGEEAGLLGAKAFFGGDALASRVGVVLNMEARGNRGRAVMFESHRGAGPLMAHLNRRGALNGSSSLMPDLYRRLPNDTDLSEALRAGHMGLNFAFFGGQAAYHRPADTPANLDPASVQHIGDQVLAAARTLADEPALPPRGMDPIYADLLGGPVLLYPPWAGWLLLAAAAALAALAAARLRPRPWQVAAGAGLLLVSTLGGAGMLFVASHLLAGPVAFQALLERYPLALAGFALLTLGTALLPFAVAQRLRPRALASEAAWPGALAVGLLAAAALQAAAPLDAFMLAWPVLAGAAAAALLAQGSRPAAAAAMVILTLGLAQVLYWAGLMFSLVGVGMPAILALFAGSAAVLVFPFAVRATAGRLAAFACLDLLALGGVILAWIALN